MVEQTGLERLCVVCEAAAEMQTAIKHLMEIEFKPEDLVARSEVLMREFSNRSNAEKLMQYLP
jgi:Flp pilus assembly CpaF family ATPase